MTSDAAHPAADPRRAARPARGAADWFGPWVQTGLFALYCLGFAAMRAAFTTTLQQDDAARHFEAQVLALSYSSNDPALYTWLLWAVQQLVGVGLHSSMLLNYGLMTGAFWALLLSGRMVLAEPRWAAAAAWGLVLLPPVILGHFALAHTTQVLFAAALALLAVLRFARFGRPADHLLLGAAIGHGFMAKYNFGLFLAAAAIAALATPAVRARLARPWALAIPATALVVASPLLLVVAQTFGQIDGTLGQLRADSAGPLVDRLIGLKSAAASLVSYTWPLLIVLGLSAPRAFRPGLPPPELAPVNHHLARLLDRYMLACLAVIAAAVLVSGIPSFHERYMQPLLFAVPLWAAVRIARAGAAGREWRRFLRGLAVAILAVAALRALELSPLCPQACRNLIPYDRLAEHLRQDVFDGDAAGAIVVTGNPVAAGNLRWHLPEARVLVGRAPAALADLPEDCACPAGQGGEGSAGPAGEGVRAAGDGGAAGAAEGAGAGEAPRCVAVWDAVEWNPPAAAAHALEGLGLTPEEAEGWIETFTTNWHWPFFNWAWPPGFAEREYEWGYATTASSYCVGGE